MPERASCSAGLWRCGSEHDRPSSCFHGACWLRGETDIKQIIAQVINQYRLDYAIPTYNSRIFICFPLLQNKISTPKHGLKALKGQAPVPLLAALLTTAAPSPRRLAPQDCLLFPRPTTPSPVAPCHCSCTLCTWHAPAGFSQLAQQVRFPFVGLFQSPSLSQPCFQSTLDLSGYSTSCVEPEICSMVPVGGGCDKGSELGVSTESRVLGEHVREVGGAHR